MADDLRILLIGGDIARAHQWRDAMYAAPVPIAGEISCESVTARFRPERPDVFRADRVYHAVAVDVRGSDEPAALVAWAATLADAPVVALIDGQQRTEAARIVRDGAAEVVLAAGDFAGHLASILRLVVARTRLADEVEAQRRRMLDLTTRDELTGLAKRRLFNDTLATEVDRARRQHKPVSLVLVNLDGLKLINDMHGYAAGDAALRHVASNLTTTARNYELAARLGDDEFAFVLSGINYEQARHEADRLRQQVAETPVGDAGLVTISAGIASVPAHAENATELMRIANQALYEAKRSGRNRVMTSRDLRRERLDPRHHVRLKLVVSGRNTHGEAFTEETETEMISRRGANVISSQTVAAGQQVELRTAVHPEPLTAQVTACYPEEEGRWNVGFKLIKPSQWTVGP